MRLHLTTRLTCLVAAVALLGSYWALDHFCDVYRLNSLNPTPKLEYTSPAEQICWQHSGGGMMAAQYLGLLVLAVAGILGDGASRPPALRIGLRALVFLGVTAALGMLSLAVVTFYFYNNLDPNGGV
jgi:hypothetical protein